MVMKMERDETNLSEFPSITEDNPLLRAGLKMTHLRMLVMVEEHGQVSAAAAASITSLSTAMKAAITPPERQPVPVTFAMRE